MGSSAVVASTIPHAVGAALSFKRRGASRIAVAVFGDGATEEGVYHESLNFAALMKVPVLFLCEDNGLAVHSHRPVRQSYRLPEHAASFGIASRRLEEGWDLLAIRQATLEAAAKVRAGEPFVLEIVTSRYKEHVGVGEDFHFNYRTSDGVDAWKRRPLIVDQKLVEALRPDIEREIEAAVAFAEATGPRSRRTADGRDLMSIAAVKPVQGTRVLSMPAPCSRPWTRRWPTMPTSSSWARASTTLRASSARPRGSPRNTAPRVCSTYLMEEGMTGVAIGASLVGDYPITTHIRADFSFLAMNQIISWPPSTATCSAA